MTTGELLPPGIARLGVVADARKAFWIDAAEAVWLVKEGAVDIFAQRRLESGQAAGALRHVFRAATGQIFLGVDFAGVSSSWGFVAVPLPETALCRLTHAELHELAAGEPARADEIVRLLEDWVATSMDGVVKPTLPTQYRSFGREDRVLAESAESLCPVAGITWTKVTSGEALWLGRADLVVGAADGALPVARSGWLTARGPLEIELVRAPALLADGGIWNATAVHHRLLLRYVLAAAEEEAGEDAAWLEEKAVRSQLLSARALARLMAVGQGQFSRDIAGKSSDTLPAACEAIGRQLGVEFRAPAASESAALARDPVGTIAAASNIRFRKVALRAQWWRTDNGPLLAQRADSKDWVALLPAGGRRYRIYVPADGTTHRLSARVAETLAPFAYSFYRPLPNSALQPRDLLRFGAHRLGNDVAMVVALGLAIGALGMVVPIASGQLIDNLIPSADKPDVWYMIAALIAAAVATSLFELARALSVLRIESKMDGRLQAALWDRVLKLPIPFFRDYTAGDLAVRVNGINTIRQALSGSTVSTLLTSVFSLFNFALLFYYSAKLALWAAALLAVAVVLTLGIGYLKLRYERHIAEIGGRISGMVFQYLRGIAKIRVSAVEDRAFSNWAHQFTALRTYRFRSENLANIEHVFFSGYTVISTGVLFAVIGMVLSKQDDFRFSTGDFVAFNAAFGSFFASIMSLSGTLLGLLSLVPIYERARPILQSLPEVDERKSHPGALQGDIEVVGVGFRYGDGAQVLRDVSFSVRAGDYVALVGPSGSGKSTLLRLLLGFEKPTAGSIYFDGQNVGDVDVNALRRQLGVVMQGGQLMTGDIFTNIVGTSQLTLEEAWEAARMVGLEDDIIQMPMGMHTVISETSSTLSMGQRQRIMIARAIVNRPRILFFDEATSALDNRTQAIVSRSLDELKATRIVIAHRLSTIVHADRILLLQDGRIVQDGDYHALMGEPGPFAELARRQIL